MKQASLSLSFLFIVLAVYPNFRLLPGYYINQHGDSVHCNIEFSDRNFDPVTVKVEVNNEKKEFSANEIRGFGVYGYNDYISATVSMHTAPIQGDNIPAQFSDSVSTKTCFLKILTRGHYSLYSLARPERVYLFMAYKDSSMTELLYRVRNNNDSLVEDQSYKKTIFNLFVQEAMVNKYFNRINTVPYTASEIKSLFNILNGSSGGASYRKKSSREFQVQLYAGGIRNAFPTVFTGHFSDVYQFKPSYSVGGGINLLYSIPGLFRAFKLGLSAGYNNYNLRITKSGTASYYESSNYYQDVVYDDTLTLKNALIQTNFYLMYLINPLSEVKCYVKAGINCNFPLNGDVSVNEKNAGTTLGVLNGNPPTTGSFRNDDQPVIYLKGTYLTPLFAAGINTGRHTLEFSYYLPSDIADKRTTFAGRVDRTFRISSMTFCYYYTLFR
jgi:hypothetical protein